MPQINPHLHFNGNAEEAFLFYRSVFGGSFSKLLRFKDVPELGQLTAEGEADKLMHIALSIGSYVVLTGSDVPRVLGMVSERENRSKIAVRAASKEEASQLFSGLSEGGVIEVPLSDSPWGSYFGMFRDRYGIEWMVEWVGSSLNQGVHT